LGSFGSPRFDPCAFGFLLLACFFDGHFPVRGGAIGGGLGYDWQSAAWVFGVEGDFSWTAIRGHSDAYGINVIQHSCGSKLENLGMLLARFGYAPGAGNWLFYSIGGFAHGEVEAWITSPMS
jgi:outer membrane immunogenic protein